MSNFDASNQQLELGALRCSFGQKLDGNCNSGQLDVERFRQSQDPQYTCQEEGTFYNNTSYKATIQRYSDNSDVMYGWFDGRTHVSLAGFPPGSGSNTTSVSIREGTNGNGLTCGMFGAVGFEFDNWKKFFYSSNTWSYIYTTQTDYVRHLSCPAWSRSSISSTADDTVTKST